MTDKATFKAIGEILQEELKTRDDLIDNLQKSQTKEIKKALDEIISNDDFKESLRGEKGESVTGKHGVSVKAIEQAIDNKSFDIVLDNGESLNVKLPEVPVDTIVEKLIEYIPTPEQAKHGEAGKDGIGIKAIEQGENNKSFDIVLDNEQTIEVNLPEPLKGETGEKGDSGIDRPITSVRKACGGLEANEVVYHNGGLYQSTKKTIGTPEEDAGAYRLILNGVDKADVIANLEERTYDFTIRKTDGEQEVITAQMMPGFVDETITKFLKGDYTVEGTKIKQWDGEQWIETQLRGATGRKGSTGVGVKSVEIHNDLLRINMTDGKLYDLPIVEKVCELLVSEYKELIIDLATPIKEDISEEIKRYAGIWSKDKNYSKGDVVTTYQGLYLALKATTKPTGIRDDWAFMLGVQTSGGSGGGGGGIAKTTTIIADGTMQMGGFNIAGLANPRAGTLGQTDAVNRYSMEQAIAAKSLYQGLYVINTNTPHLATLTDTGFVPPVAGQIVNNPNVGATPPVTTPGADILTWCNWGGNGFDTFTTTTTKPTAITIKLSNGKMVTSNIPAGAYADEAALATALETAFTGHPEIAHFHVYVNGTDCHIGVETVAPIYCIGVSDQTGNPFPIATEGAGNTVLNSYNWVIKTADENQPEALPPGLPGIPAGTVVKNSDSLIWSEVNHKFEIASGSSLTQSFADDRYWQVDGHNMAWTDRAYNKNSIVYSTAKNAWFVTTQDITVGSPAPGTLAAGAMYRKINSTYGSTVLYGKGDFDPTDTTAANRWGMPAGTYPSGQQPLNGDTYFNILSGSTTSFVVTEHPPEFIIRGTFDDRFGIASTTADDNVLDTWPLHAPTIPHGSAVHVTTGHVFIGGQFQGTMVGGEFYIVWSGDPDADDGGWVIVPKANLVNHQAPWQIGTPHPQTVPDTIVGNTNYGFIRNITVQLRTNVPVNSHVVLVKKIPDVSFRLTCELLDENDGTIYEFFLTNIRGSHTPEITPVNILPAGLPGIEEIIVHYDATNLIYITAVINANGQGRTYKLEINTQDFSLGLIEKGNGFEVLPGKTSSFASMNKYPAQLIPMQLIGAKNLIGDASGVLLTISHSVEVGHIYQISSVVRAVYDNESDYFETQLGVDVGGVYTRHNSFYSTSKGGRYESSLVGLDIYKATKSENLKFVLKLAAYSAGVILKDSSFSVIDMGV